MQTMLGHLSLSSCNMNDNDKRNRRSGVRSMLEKTFDGPILFKDLDTRKNLFKSYTPESLWSLVLQKFEQGVMWQHRDF